MPEAISMDEAIRTLEYRLSEDLVYHLYKNDVEPNIGSILSDFEESDFGNYSEKTILSTDWATPVSMGDFAGATCEILLYWIVIGSPLNDYAYGYYITRSGEYVGGERFLFPVPMNVEGASLAIVPQMYEGTPLP